MKLIGLENLPEKFRVGLNTCFRKRLFSFARNKTRKAKILGKILGMHTDTILRQEKGIVFMKVDTLKKLSKITNMSIEDIEKQIIELKTRNVKQRIQVRFPIFASKELASLIGHCIGDGNLSERQFSFFNLQRELIDEIISDVRVAFFTDIKPKEFKKDGGWEVEFPTCIATLVFLSGAPRGVKVFTGFRIPKWILNGSDEIKIEFVRALFDDEGSIRLGRGNRDKGFVKSIEFNMAKNENLIEDHEFFLQNIRQILLDLGIQTTEVKRRSKTVNGIFMGFTITNVTNLTKFAEKINFSHLKKNQKLNNWLENLKSIGYYELLQIPLNL